jgi:hypothetical protein
MRRNLAPSLAGDGWDRRGSRTGHGWWSQQPSLPSNHARLHLRAAAARRLDLFCGRVLHDGARARLLSLPVPVDRSDRGELLALLASRPSAQELAEFVAPRPAPCLQNADGTTTTTPT